MATKQKQQKLSEAEAVALIAGALTVGASEQSTAQRLSGPLGISPVILAALILLARSRAVKYVNPAQASTSAATESSRLEPTYRAHYIYAASQRVQTAVRRGVPREQALITERRWFNQHIDAVRNRAEAAKAVDEAAAKFGPDLGWYARLDSRTSAECRQAHGKNFSVSRMPAIGYPGAVHPHCRCKPGRAHRTSQTVYSVQSREVKAA